MKSFSRREFLNMTMYGTAAGAFFPHRIFAADPAKKPLNIMLITADDLNWDSMGVYGCPIKDITPHIDKLASKGTRFNYAYSTIAVCQPVRATMHTGLYPHRSGCEGFEPVKSDVVIVNEIFHKAGYLISMFGKNGHYQPHAKYHVDFEWQAEQGNRNPEKIYDFTKEFLEKAKKDGKPFFNQINCGDPHRPFYGAPGGNNTRPSRIITPEEVPVPKFLEELPDVRKEVAQYFNCVKRLDDCIGMAMKALGESGMADNTLVMFYGGDHGMSFPFAKSNMYEQSNHGGLIVNWPGVTKPGTVEDKHMVSTIDFTPTLLEAAGLEAIPGIDGRSFVPILKGEKQDKRDQVYTCYYYTSAGKCFLMKSVRTMNDSYIWNAWSDGETTYKAENMAGLSWNAMVEAGKSNPEIQKRVDFYLHRVPEEYYDDLKGSCERTNLINDKSYAKRIDALRAELHKLLDSTSDPASKIFVKRNDKEAVRQFIKDISESHKKTSKNKKNKDDNE